MIKLEYIWIDGTEHAPQLRSKTKVLQNVLMDHPQIKQKVKILIVF